MVYYIVRARSNVHSCLGWILKAFFVGLPLLSNNLPLWGPLVFREVGGERNNAVNFLTWISRLRVSFFFFFPVLYLSEHGCSFDRQTYMFSVFSCDLRLCTSWHYQCMQRKYFHHHFPSSKKRPQAQCVASCAQLRFNFNLLYNDWNTTSHN